MLAWIEAHEIILWWLLATSIGSFLAALIGAPLWVVSIPSDYFSEKTHRPQHLFRPDLIGALRAIGRNLFGVVLVLIGILMLVLPGQGILTILVGIMLMDIPGKYRIARSIVSRPPILQSMNWIRRRAGRGPLVLDE
jgi:hypothetical protein